MADQRRVRRLPALFAVVVALIATVGPGCAVAAADLVPSDWAPPTSQPSGMVQLPAPRPTTPPLPPTTAPPASEPAPQPSEPETPKPPAPTLSPEEDPDVHPQPVQPTPVPTKPGCKGNEWIDSLLPAIRWQEGASSITRAPNGGLKAALAAVFTDQPTNTSYQWAASLWGSTVQFTEGAVRFCPTEAAGGAVDRAAGAIAKQVTESSLIAVLALVMVVGLFVGRAARAPGGKLKPLLGFVVAVAVIAILGGQAMMSIGGGATPGDTTTKYNPAPLSPGWVVSKVDSSVRTIAQAPLDSLQTKIEEVVADNQQNSGPLSCSALMVNMKDGYEVSWGIKDKAGRSVPWAVSNIWVSTSLEAWRQVQFQGSAYSDDTWCRFLDSFKTTTPMKPSGTSLYITTGKTPYAYPDGKLPFAFQQFHADDWNARSAFMVLWAGCRVSATADVGNLANEHFEWRDDGLKPASVTSTDDACRAFFTDPDWTGWDKFIPPTKEDKIAKQTKGHPEAEKFLGALVHNGSYLSDWGMSIAALLGAVASFGAFGVIIAGGLFVSKLMLLFMGVMLMVEVLIGLFKRDPWKALVGWGFRLIGVSVYVVAVGVLFALVGLFATLLVGLSGVLPGGRSGLIGVLVCGFSPVLALWIVAKLFKKAGLPNPISLTGAMAYGKSVQAVGAAADPRNTDFGESALGKLGRKAKHEGSKITRMAGKGLEGYIMGKVMKNKKDGDDGGDSDDKNTSKTTGPETTDDTNDDADNTEENTSKGPALDEDGNPVEGADPDKDWTASDSDQAKEFFAQRRAERKELNKQNPLPERAMEAAERRVQQARDRAQLFADDLKSGQALTDAKNKIAQKAPELFHSLPDRLKALDKAKAAKIAKRGLAAGLMFTPLAPVVMAGVVAQKTWKAGSGLLDNVQGPWARHKAELDAWQAEAARRQQIAAQNQTVPEEQESPIEQEPPIEQESPNNQDPQDKYVQDEIDFE